MMSSFTTMMPSPLQSPTQNTNRVGDGEGRMVCVGLRLGVLEALPVGVTVGVGPVAVGVALPFAVGVRVAGVRVRVAVRSFSRVGLGNGVNVLMGVKVRIGVNVWSGVKYRNGVKVPSGVNVPGG